MIKTQLTSVKVPVDIFELFKIECVRNKFSITKLTERCMFLYITDEEWRKNIHNTLDTQISGSI